GHTASIFRIGMADAGCRSIADPSFILSRTSTGTTTHIIFGGIRQYLQFFFNSQHITTKILILLAKNIKTESWLFINICYSSDKKVFIVYRAIFLLTRGNL